MTPSAKNAAAKGIKPLESLLRHRSLLVHFSHVDLPRYRRAGRLDDAGLDREKKNELPSSNEDEDAPCTWEEVSGRRRLVYRKIKGRLRQSNPPAIEILNARSKSQCLCRPLPDSSSLSHFTPDLFDLSASRHRDCRYRLRMGD